MTSDARVAALRYLKIRPRSVFELTEKLRIKGFDAAAIGEVVDDLIRMKLLNDRVFADAWVRYRLARPFGFLRIVRELKEKGVSQDIIDVAVNTAKSEYLECDVILDLAKRKLLRVKDVPIEKRNKRVLDFLIRRGYKVEDAFKAIKKLGKM